MVMSPGSYTKLSVYYQALLRSGASLALYEICRRYATNPSKVTNRAEWEWWYGAITGNPVREELPEYKYFKRDVIKPAIAEINLVTDINIELIEHKVGRRVAQLQFAVTQSQQSALMFPAPPVIDGDLVQRMMVLGLSQEDACDLLATNEEAKLRATLDLVETRIRSPKAGKIESPAGYFKIALRDGYAAPTEVAKKTLSRLEKKPDVEASISAIRERYLVERAKEAFSFFKELSDEEQGEWLARFKQSGAAKGISLAKGLATNTARTAFSMWLAAEQWADPTDSELLAFAAVQAK